MSARASTPCWRRRAPPPAPPWPPQRAEVNAILFHQMAGWLPEDEREELRAAFRAELARLAEADGPA